MTNSKIKDRELYDRVWAAYEKANHNNSFLFSLAVQMEKGRDMSEKQVAAAEKVMAAINQRAEEREAKLLADNNANGAWDEGRQTVSGKVIEIKQAERWEGGHYYGTTAIVDKIKLDCGDGKTIIFTATASCYEGESRAVYSFEKETPLKFGIGDEIVIDLTVKVHKDKTFWAYGSRGTLKA